MQETDTHETYEITIDIGLGTMVAMEQLRQRLRLPDRTPDEMARFLLRVGLAHMQAKIQEKGL